MKDEKIKYGLIGSNGRLGSEVINVFAETGFELVYELNKDYENKSAEPQLLIDCSLPEGLEKSIYIVNALKIPFIVAATGLNVNHFEQISELAKNVPVVQSYNYSVGIQVLLKLVDEVQKTVPDWDVEISETHHRFKKDKPSGTAIMIKNVLKKKDVNISSLRLGNVSGVHTISFGGLGEVLSITHDATSRRTFAEGILKSAGFILNKKPGLYSFKDVVFS